MTGSTVFVGMNGWVDEAVPAQVNDETRGLKLDHTSSAFKRAFLWFKLPFTPGDDVDVSEAILTVRLKGAWSGSRDIEVKRITDSWSARNLKWNNAPGVGSSTAAETVAGGAAGDEVEIDVTTLLAEVADGTDPWLGLRANSSTGGPVSLWAKEALDPTFRPKLRVTWTEQPDAATELSPAGGRVVSKAKPNLGWMVPGVRGETSQANAQVQVSTTTDTADITFDSGMIALSETEIDLSDATYSAPSIADGAGRYWRVRYEDDQGRQSPWSVWAHFTRQSQGTLAFDSPTDGATIEDLTPEVLLSFSGATLEALALFLEKIDDDGVSWIELYRRPRKVSDDTSITIPKGNIRKTSDQYRFRGRAWDDQDREWRPGDPPYVEAIVEFTWDRDTGIDPVDTITVQQHADGSPLVDVVVTTDDAPSYFCLAVDGDRRLGYERIDPEDVVTGVGEYTIVYSDAVPRVNATYEVERVGIDGGVLKHSKTNPTDVYASTPTGIWLWDADDPETNVRLGAGGGGGDFEWSEVAGDFRPMGRPGVPQGSVRILQSTGGREGTVAGNVRDNGSVKADTYLARLRRIWRSGRVVRLLMAKVNIPVTIGQPHDSPLPPPEVDVAYHVEFTARQVGDFDR